MKAAQADWRSSADGYLLCVGVTGAEMAERLTSWAWWTGDRQPYSKLGRPIGGSFLGATREGGDDHVFTWKYGRADVTLTWEGDHWRVAHAADGRLLGPRQTLYEARHRRSDIAVWDVMARVIHACRDEAVGLDIAREAARWMRGRDWPVGES